MVSLWPWKGEDSSPASFERALSALSVKISKAQTNLDTLRQRSRRYKALWTLYTSLAYMLCSIILGLVVGIKNCNTYEYTALAGSPVLIYLGRTVVTAYYDYRINLWTSRLEESQAERKKTINKLKEATKYNSTQQLLEKYGETPAPKPRAPSNSSKNTKKNQTPPSGRTGMGPPPTANIPGRNQPIPQAVAPPQMQQSRPQTSQSVPQAYPAGQNSAPSIQPEFAPNAFASRQYSATDTSGDGRWYDRVLDLLLGDDETSPKNRIVLICNQCRLVNGQAPPGAKRLEDVGKWRCAACHAMNGEEDEGRKIVAEIKEQLEEKKETRSEEAHLEKPEMIETQSKTTEDSSEGEEEVEEEEVSPVVRKTRAGRAKK